MPKKINSSAYSIIDSAGLLSEKVNKLKTHIEKFYQQLKVLDAATEFYDNLSKKDIDLILNKWQAYFSELMENSKTLISYSEEKFRLINSARTRPVKFYKTGNVKLQINELIKDTDIQYISHQLTSIHQMLNAFLNFIIKNDDKFQLFFLIKDKKELIENLLEKGDLSGEFKSLFAKTLLVDLVTQNEFVIESVLKIYNTHLKDNRLFAPKLN